MQEPLLFNTTIKENILYGNDQADDTKVRQVAQMANALHLLSPISRTLKRRMCRRRL
jgi:ABC-type multidrug transport system fused ATPase/permease subunit